MVIKDKKIILGVTGGVAAYRACEIIRRLGEEGAAVWPVMTEAATRFVTPLSLSTLAAGSAYHDLFAENPAGISHIELAEKADVILIAPATANVIGKIASGIADDLLTTVVMASEAPKLVAPAMNHRMYENPVVQENIGRLKSRGFKFVGPEYGALACGWEGMGRLSRVEDIIEAVKDVLSGKDLEGEKVLVTAGSTREAIDPVRFLSNASSGRMGYSLARAAKRRGAEVVLVSGPTYLAEPAGVTVVKAVSAEDMMDAAIRYYPQSTVVIMAAAVSDFRPVDSHPRKVKKENSPLTLDLERTPDILKEMGKKKKKGQVLVGFALETENLVENATAKLREKNLDMVVANGPAGLDSDVTQAILIGRAAGGAEKLPLLSKEEVSERILDRVKSLIASMRVR
ncbi:MAG: bifunctional phosphopantothenoylcysteine decarboxylase/phosphopantothenate--cysteine ligase CoaBC [Deltaproteobacteria bacterium]|nr:bifunctional phosphopantothenoylcysteine decarboxylase/phosphopantothenate--cysteine ligase CoaBC [Deltaproteobacteria bacterium]